MDTQTLINLIAPLAAKFAVDALRRFWPKLRAWQIQLLAIGTGSVGAWAAKFAGGADLPVWQAVLMGALTIVANEVGNTVKGLREDKGQGSGNGGLVQTTKKVGMILLGLLLAGGLKAQETDADVLDEVAPAEASPPVIETQPDYVAPVAMPESVPQAPEAQPVDVPATALAIPLPVLFGSATDGQLTWEWAFSGLTNILQLTKRVSVDSGMAARFNSAGSLYPTTGQSFTLASLRRGSWRWSIIQYCHANTWFPGVVEDQQGFGTELVHLEPPPAVTTLLNAPGEAAAAASHDTIRANLLIDWTGARFGCRVWSSSTALANLKFGTESSGYAVYCSFPAFK
jgi:hypothetical protein